MPKTAIEKLENLIAIQTTDGNWNYDAYMQGMANGLILARSVFTDEEPQFLEAPKAWLSDPIDPRYDPEVEARAKPRARRARIGGNGAAAELADILFKAGLCRPYPKALVDAEEIVRQMSRRGCHVWREYR